VYDNSTKPGAPRLVIRTNWGTLTSSSGLEAISILYIVRTRLTLDQRLLTGTVVRYSHIVVRHISDVLYIDRTCGVLSLSSPPFMESEKDREYSGVHRRPCKYERSANRARGQSRDCNAI